MSTLHTIGSTY